jgi:hypothetical protein
MQKEINWKKPASRNIAGLSGSVARVREFAY